MPARRVVDDVGNHQRPVLHVAAAVLRGECRKRSLERSEQREQVWSSRTSPKLTLSCGSAQAQGLPFRPSVVPACIFIERRAKCWVPIRCASNSCSCQRSCRPQHSLPSDSRARPSRWLPSSASQQPHYQVHCAPATEASSRVAAIRAGAAARDAPGRTAGPGAAAGARRARRTPTHNVTRAVAYRERPTIPPAPRRAPGPASRSASRASGSDACGSCARQRCRRTPAWICRCPSSWRPRRPPGSAAT